MTSRRKPKHDRRSRPPLARMLQIHQALQAGGYPNATTLASQLEVCTKSINRDLEFMRDRLELAHPIRRQAVWLLLH